MDVTTDRNSGKTCTTSHDNVMVWNGHLCEGANVVAPIGREFCLWTRCGKHDVPGGKAHEGALREVTCEECRTIWNDENGQFGVGA